MRIHRSESNDTFLVEETTPLLVSAEMAYTPRDSFPGLSSCRPGLILLLKVFWLPLLSLFKIDRLRGISRSLSLLMITWAVGREALQAANNNRQDRPSGFNTRISIDIGF